MENLADHYQVHLPKADQSSGSRPSRLSTFARKVRKFSRILFFTSIVFTLLYFSPWLYYRIIGVRNNTEILGNTAGFETIVPELKREAYVPRLDSSLPKESRIKIASAGIDTTINEATLENYEDALQIGVWRVSNFGTPSSQDKPVILAAHRLGYLKWSVPYRLKNSFYNLPKAKTGDLIEIIWNQRKYVYEVYAEEQGDKITDYTADLILYTCEALDSPVRIFKYARLLEL